MISHNTYPLTAGDSLYNYGLIKAISEICKVDLYSLLEKDIPCESVELDIQGNCYFYHQQEVYKPSKKAEYARVFNVDRKMFEDICFAIENNCYKYVVVMHIVMARYVELLKKKYPKIKIIYVSQNVEIENKKMFDVYEASLKRRSIVRKTARFFLKKYEFMLHKQYEKMLVTDTFSYFSVSREDIEIHKKIYGKLSPSYFAKPLIEFPCSKTKECLHKFNKRLLIAGSMSWFPNVNGIIWFIENVMSVLSQEGYQLYLVGNAPAQCLVDISEKYKEYIILTGRVPSMDEYFEKCDISIIPIFTGTGAKIKVLESIARGIPTVSTTYAAKDYDLVDEVIIADTAESFINAIHELEEIKEKRIMLFEKMQSYYKRYMQLNPEIVSLLTAK